MPGSNFLLFCLMATNLSTEETVEQVLVGGKKKETAHWVFGEEASLFTFVLFL